MTESGIARSLTLLELIEQWLKEDASIEDEEFEEDHVEFLRTINENKPEE